MVRAATADRASMSTVAEVLSVLNQKGGVGKTTVTLGLASAAQQAGDPVLVVDLDPQGSAGWAMGVEASDDHLSVGDVLRTGDPRVAEAATVTSGWGEGVDILPASANLIDREGDDRDHSSMLRLRTALSPLLEKYRYVFIDCAPSLGPTTRAGLSASDGVLVVVELSALSLRGVDVVLRTIDELWQQLNPDLGVGGVIVNRAPAVSVEAMRQAEELEELVGSDVLMRPFIPQRTVLNEAVAYRSPLHRFGYRARRVAEVFDQLYEQIGQMA